MNPELKKKILCLQRIVCVGNEAQRKMAAFRLRMIRLERERSERKTGEMRK